MKNQIQDYSFDHRGMELLLHRNKKGIFIHSLLKTSTEFVFYPVNPNILLFSFLLCQENAIKKFMTPLRSQAGPAKN